MNTAIIVNTTIETPGDLNRLLELFADACTELGLGIAEPHDDMTTVPTTIFAKEIPEETTIEAWLEQCAEGSVFCVIPVADKEEV